MKSMYLLSAVVALTAAVPAAAQVVSSRANFVAQTSGVTTIDFNQFTGATDQNLGGVTTIGGVTFTDSRIAGLGPDTFFAGPAYGSGYIEWQGSSPSVLTITLSSAVTAVGFDFMELFAETMPFTITAGGQSFTATSGETPAFFGFLSAAPITTITISAPANIGFPTIDNFSFGTAGAAVTSAVPEPATWGMMILGFGVIGAGMRRRQTVRTRVAYA